MINSGDLQELLIKIKNGDEEAFELLVNKTEKNIFSIAYNMLGNWHDAYDVSQEVYIKIYKYIKSYNLEKEFRLWLYKIVINCCYDFLKNKGSQISSLDEIAGSSAQITYDLDADVTAKQLLAKAFNFLKLLSPAERAVFLFRDVKNLSSKEIAKILGCTQITVRRHSNNARNKLKKFIEGIP